jgi:hypothetical protein
MRAKVRAGLVFLQALFGLLHEVPRSRTTTLSLRSLSLGQKPAIEERKTPGETATHYSSLPKRGMLRRHKVGRESLTVSVVDS